MKIYLDMILDRLGSGSSLISGKLLGASPVSKIKVLNNYEEDYKPDILYITTASVFQKCMSGGHEINIICVNDDMQTKINILLEEIVDIIAKYIQWADRLFEAMVQKKDLRYIINIGYEMLENPMNITDNSLKLLAHTETVDTDSWTSLVQKGYVSENSIPSPEIKSILQKLKNTNTPVLVESNYIKYPAILTNILIDDKRAGILAVIAFKKPFNESDIKLIAFLSVIISQEMQKNELIRNSKGIVYEYLINELLDDDISDNNVIEERLKYLNWELNKNIFSIVVRPVAAGTPFEKILKTRDQLVDFFNFGKCALYEETIVIILSCKTEYPLSEEVLKRLGGFLAKSGMYAGISQSFHNLSEMKKHYRQALKAIDFGSRTGAAKTIFFYKDFIINHIFDCLAENKDLKEFCHPSIFALMEYDGKHNTSFTETLRAYIKYSGNQVATADSLFVHRNTLLYRLEKIVEMTDIDLKDNDTLFHLQLSFKFLDYLKESV